MELELAGYAAAREAAACFSLSDRGRFTVTGRAPGQMLGGVVSGAIPGEPATSDAGHQTGERRYSTVLTPKGRMVSDLYLVRTPGADEAFALDVSPAGVEALTAHLARVMPPRFARVTDVSSETDQLILVGPEAAGRLAAALEAVGTSVTADALLELVEDGVIFPAGSDGLWVAASADGPGKGFVVAGSLEHVGRLKEAFEHAGVVAGTAEAWRALRIEAGTPEYGTDMTEETIPIEAGIEERAIDGAKGCYTGQEVIVRILHRGHVNRHLRALRIDATTALPEPRSELFTPGQEKAVGWVTSTVDSPLHGGGIGLGYVRREVDVGSEVRVGDPDGPPATVLERGALRS